MLARRFALVVACAFGLSFAACSANDDDQASAQTGGETDESACLTADNKLAECGMPLAPTEDCTGPYKCFADCVNGASCEEIRDPESSPVYGNCLENAQACP